MTDEEIRAISDPYRLRIMGEIRSAGDALTVKQIADRMKETPSKVFYHVKKLEKNGILKIVRTKVVNGIVAKFYNFTAKRFTLKNRETDKSIDNIDINSYEKIMSTLFDENKKMIINSLKGYYDQGLKEKITLCSSSVFLSKDEEEEFKNSFEKLIDKYSDRKKEPGKSEIAVFYSIFRLVD